MRLMHSLYAQLSVVKSAALHHFNFIDDFLVDKAAFFTPSSLECCPPRPPAFPLTRLAFGKRPDRKNTKSRIVSVHSDRSGFFLLGLLVLASSTVKAETLTVATAANFQQALKALQGPFTKQTGEKLTIVTGSSGALATQIINGAPYDIFLSADTKRPQQLVEKGFADPETLVTYAYGRLTLWSRDKNLIADNNGPAVLKTGKFRHLAYANPALAPYGVAAIQTLASLNLLSKLKGKTVRGENISQTFAMLATGAAPLGFIARSQLARDPWKSTGSYWHVPANLHRPIKQAGIVVKNSKHKPAARRFMAFIKSDPAKIIIKSFGYDTK